MADYTNALAELSRIQAANWPAEVSRTVDYPAGEQTLVAHLRHWARERPSATAINFYGRLIDYAEYDEASDRFAGWLDSVGVVAGDRVGVHLGNCPQVHIAMLGILKAGAVYVPINPMFKGHELRYELLDADVGVLLTQPDLRPLADEAVTGTSVHTVATTALGDLLDTEPDITVPFPAGPQPDSDWASILTAPRAPARTDDPDALAALNYTGGTTGMPKGCEHTQRHMAYTAATITVAGGGTIGDPEPVALNFLPVFWIAGEDFGIIGPLLNGQTVVLMTRWDPAVSVQLIERYGVTQMIATIDNYVEMSGLPDFTGSRLASIRNAFGVSFVLKLDPEFRSRWRDLTGITLREASYGMTETHTGDTFTLGFQDGDRDLLADPVFCGLPVPGTEILVVDEQGEPVPIGESGQIIVRSPSVMTAYYGRPDATADTLHDGWLQTGDVGCFDDWGALHYLARTKEMIKINGMSVFPSEVEALLRLHTGVGAVSVVPRPDPDRGQVPVAFVVPADPALTAPDLRAWAKDNMAGYKVPEVILVEQLPMTATGKIRKGELLDRAAAGR
ncbi:AMP-binding protein [Gordonia amarae]|uniref:AMP-binding protein n=2 Tax=Gordonia amarae TaxID=36821 RepID=A0A857LVE6_9ACTN|nr:AMP-binding protein [Gordonia amarae]MCS3881044.1 acyl-CoA synthetase (AMP-forming)/AMP-acid ligase II [Gordonia amarae]QHN19272.1 AMP-binding protein [Gordonia amarae]QHN23748.1 AMP-binding protein [Gordonia amarae]QHN32660.1 AMP-binding protein [Gordonia amarae]QHN41408.1 AMP-binding protein [Gordonia amarae]